MKKFTGRFDKNTVRVYDEETLYGSIDFNRDLPAHADIFIYSDRFHIGPKSPVEKDIVLTKADVPLFTFAFDKIWGGAEIKADGNDTGYDVKGRWFRAGTRLIDADDKDIVVVVTNEMGDPEITITVYEKTAPVMVLSTLYYHLYASRSKQLALAIGNAFVGAI